jgi:uncharacterized hydrophobic protein (TIGR00271 family)
MAAAGRGEMIAARTPGHGRTRDMINLEIFGESAPMSAIAEVLDHVRGVARVRLIRATRSGHSVVAAAVRPEATDEVLEELRRHGVPDGDITLTRVEVVGSIVTESRETSLVWADVIGSARLAARPVARYLAFMCVAGVIASYGVVDNNGILIVGAMAVSPDLLPITAIAVGIFSRHGVLVGRALLTVVVGLAAASAVAALSALAQNHLGLLPGDFTLQAEGVLGGLTTVNNETIAVALVAGIAGMLALETRASAGVGVAISVTTIPAAAYLGVAAGLGGAAKALGALAVLGTNVAMMVAGAVATLAAQSAVKRRDRNRRSRRSRI